jgi:hypothetical protein
MDRNEEANVDEDEQPLAENADKLETKVDEDEQPVAGNADKFKVDEDEQPVLSNVDKLDTKVDADEQLVAANAEKGATKVGDGDENSNEDEQPFASITDKSETIGVSDFNLNTPGLGCKKMSNEPPVAANADKEAIKVGDDEENINEDDADKGATKVGDDDEISWDAHQIEDGKDKSAHVGDTHVKVTTPPPGSDDNRAIVENVSGLHEQQPIIKKKAYN